MNADGSGQHAWRRGGSVKESAAYEVHPDWSPDGRLLAYTSNVAGRYQIYVANGDGTNARRIGTGKGESYGAAWSPDGKTIAFSGYRGGHSRVYSMDADGSHERQLTHGPGDDYSPTWSPDGRRIAFDSTRDGDSNLFVMNRDGSGPRRLTSGLDEEDYASWSPDGKSITFESDRDISYEIYVMGARRKRKAVDARVTDIVPRWSPDGQLDRVLHQPRSQLGDLRDERQRQQPAAPHTQPGGRRLSELLPRRAPDPLRPWSRRKRPDLRDERERDQPAPGERIPAAATSRPSGLPTSRRSPLSAVATGTWRSMS